MRFRFVCLGILLAITLLCFILSPAQENCQPPSWQIGYGRARVTLKMTRQRWSIKQEGFGLPATEGWINW